MRSKWIAQQQVRVLGAGIQAHDLLTETWRPPARGKTLLVDQVMERLHVNTESVEIRVMPISTGAPPYYTPSFRGVVGFYAGKIYGYGSWADDAWFPFAMSRNIYFRGAPTP